MKRLVSSNGSVVTLRRFTVTGDGNDSIGRGLVWNYAGDECAEMDDPMAMLGDGALVQIVTEDMTVETWVRWAALPPSWVAQARGLQ